MGFGADLRGLRVAHYGDLSLPILIVGARLTDRESDLTDKFLWLGKAGNRRIWRLKAVPSEAATNGVFLGLPSTVLKVNATPSRGAEMPTRRR